MASSLYKPAAVVQKVLSSGPGQTWSDLENRLVKQKSKVVAAAAAAAVAMV